MSGILKIGMLKRLKDWSIDFLPQLVRESFSMNRCEFLDRFCGLRQGVKKKQDWDLFGVLPF